MSTPNQFKIYLLSTDTPSPIYLYWDYSNDTIATTTIPTELTYAPDGWQDADVKAGRSAVYNGLFREYTLPYRFVADGANILRTLWNARGIEATCKLLIKIRNDSDWTFSTFISADLDFLSADDQDTFFSVAAKESGLSSLLKAYEDTEVVVELTGPDVIDVDYDSQLLQSQTKWITTWPPAEYAGHPIGTNPVNVPAQWYALPTYALVDSKINVDSTGQASVTAQSQLNAPGPGLNGMFFTNTAIIDAIFKGRFRLTFDNTTGSVCNFDLCIISTTASNHHIIGGGSVPAGTANVPFDFPFTSPPINIPAGRNVTIFLRVYTGGSGIWWKWEGGDYLSVTYKSYSPSFSAKGMRVCKVFEKVVDKMTNSQYTGSSAFLSNAAATLAQGIDNIPYDTILMSGDSIRGVNTSGYNHPVIKIKLSDLFKFTDVVWGTGMTIINNVLKLEQFGTFFDANDVIYDLGVPAKVRINNAQEYLYNKISIGYPDQEYDEVNGRDEFNTTHIYSTPITRTKKELQLISPIRVDMYGIFYTWANYSLMDKKDSKNDNNIFATEINHTPEGSGHYKAKYYSGGGISISGVIDPPHSFNLGLTPKRCLLRKGNFFRSLMYGLGASNITFQTTDKNATLVSTLNAGTITENADILISSLASPTFHPFIFTVEVESPDNLLTLLDIHPYGVFTFSYRDVQLKGFPMEAGVKPANPQIFTFKLLSASTNNHNLLKED